MKDKIQITPRICVCDTHEYIHEKSFSELTFQNTILNIRISHVNLENIKAIKYIKVLNQEIELDFNAMTASYGWTTNPLYTFKHENVFITEISIYNFKELFQKLSVLPIQELIVLNNQNNHQIEFEVNKIEQMSKTFNENLLTQKEILINHEYKKINEYLKTWLDTDFSHINIEAQNEFFIYFQYVIGGEFFEVEKHYPKGSYKLKLDYKPSHYFGICFNMPLNDFIDYDHKHIVYGQLGLSSVKILNYENNLFHAYLSDKFMYKQCFNVLTNINEINPHQNKLSHQSFNFIENFFTFSLLKNHTLITHFISESDARKNAFSFEVNEEDNLEDIFKVLKNIKKVNFANFYLYLTLNLDNDKNNITEEIEKIKKLEEKINILAPHMNILYKTSITFSLFDDNLKHKISCLNELIKKANFYEFFMKRNFIEKSWLNNNVNNQEDFYEKLIKNKRIYYGFSYTRPNVTLSSLDDTIIQRAVIDQQKRIYKGCIDCPYQKNSCQYAMSFPIDKKQTNYIYFNNGLTIDMCDYKNIVKKIKKED